MLPLLSKLKELKKFSIFIAKLNIRTISWISVLPESENREHKEQELYAKIAMFNCV